MSDDMRKLKDTLDRIAAGDGFVRQGETADSAPPDFVRPGADPELCKEALQLLSRHLQAEIKKLVDDEPRFKPVFIDDLSGN